MSDDLTAFPAVFTMHTPQGPTHACVRHARMVENLFRFLGAHVNATKAPEDAQCANCNQRCEQARRHFPTERPPMKLATLALALLSATAQADLALHHG